MRVNIRYICAGCGWRWSRDFDAPIKVAARIVNAGEVVISVPETVSPCCGEEE